MFETHVEVICEEKIIKGKIIIVANGIYSNITRKITKTLPNSKHFAIA